MAEAMRNGATVAEIVDTLELAGSETYRSFWGALSIARSELGDEDLPPLPDELAEFTDAYRERHGHWPQWLDVAVRTAPALVPLIVRYISIPDRPFALDPKSRALILLALYASPTTADAEGVRSSTALSRDAGASPAEIYEAICLGSLNGTHSFSRGYMVLQQSLATDKDRSGLGFTGE
jgi:alkylhydroperoxidase/carboxymuconolactone decarboxylase family protein YurZ